MTREEAITVLKGLYDNPLFGDVHKVAFNIAIHDIKAYHKWNLNELVLTQKDNEQETVSKESYDHEYFLRKELEIKIAKLEQQEPILDKINKMKSEIADSLEFWDYSPNNNPLARDMLETLTNFWGDIKAESENT